MKKIFWALWICLLLILPDAYPVRSANGVTIPPGFRKIDAAVGIELYEKDYPGGSPDFVQVIDLSQGASLKPLHGAITDPGVGQGVYGGSDAHFRSLSLGAYWQQLASQDSSAFCVVNGQFFYMLEYPTRLPFPLKIDGQVLTDGYGIKDFPGQKLMLELWPGKADITPLSKEALYASSAPDIIAGLTEDAPKAKKRYTGRTFIGLTGPNREGQFETLMIFNTQTARQVEAASVLKSFGAQKVMMLDGGGSTQLLCRGRSYIYSDRLVPQAIGIVAGEPGWSPPAATDQPAAQNQAAAQEKPVTGPAVLQAAPAPAPANSNPATNDPAQSGAAHNPPGRAEGPVTVLLPILFSNTSGERPSPAGTQAASQMEGSPAPAATATPEPPTGAMAASLPPAQAPNPASIPAAQEQAVLAAGISPMRLDDVLWVPAGMAPVVLFLLVAIFKLRRPE